MPNPRPDVIAHRGASSCRPENSLAAFQEAIRLACDGIELDLQLSRDGVPVVFHDKDLSRFGEPALGIHDLSLGEVRLLELPATTGDHGAPGRDRDTPDEPQRIPTLEEVLSACGRRIPLLLEVKTREGVDGWLRHVELMRLTLRAVQARGLDAWVSILCYDPHLLEICARQAPHLPRVLNLAPPSALDASLIELAARHSALSLSVRTLTPEFAAAIRETPLRVLVFTCNDAAQVDLALQTDPAAIMSDRPGWLRRRLRSLRVPA